MYCIDDEGSPYELNEKPYAMPAKVILEDNERPEEILDTLDTHFQNLVDEFATQELSRYYSRENRYEEGIPKPTFPIVMHDVSHSTKPRSSRTAGALSCSTRTGSKPSAGFRKS
jgi:hypothetical protein